MTPRLPDILVGQAIGLTTPLPPEAGPDYLAGRAGILAMLASLAAQEAERGVAARVWENGAIAALLAKAGAEGADAAADLSLTALDAANADLRRQLITLHEGAEAHGDKPLQAEVLALYVEMAAARRLQLGG
ncbi:MAG: hypothetical protein ABSD80_11575 [Caulobacteraceae bacterium]|jgi:hypothetical protein